MGIGGAYHSWSPLYPDPGGLLIDTCDLVLEDGVLRIFTQWIITNFRGSQSLQNHVAISQDINY